MTKLFIYTNINYKFMKKVKNIKGLRTNPRCKICGKEMFPEAFRFRQICAECTQVHSIMSKNLKVTEKILRLIYQEKGST